jgi:hypothetical protein
MKGVQQMAEVKKEPQVLKGILTLGELREWTKDLPDSTQITLGTSDVSGMADEFCEYANVNEVTIPDGVEYFFLNLNAVDTFDSRQL